MLTDKTVDEFINEKSAEMFRRFKIDDSFLSCDPENWSSHEAYIDGEKIVKSLRVVNDTAERAVKLMEDYHGLLTKDENQKKYILQCVQEHRKIYTNCSKTVLSKNY